MKKQIALLHWTRRRSPIVTTAVSIKTTVMTVASPILHSCTFRCVQFERRETVAASCLGIDRMLLLVYELRTRHLTLTRSLALAFELY